MKKVLLLIMLGVALSGCAKPQLVRNEINGSEKVVYEIPSENAGQGHLSGLSFNVQPGSWYESNFRHERGASVSSVRNNQLELQFVNAMISSSGSPIGSYKKYVFKVDSSSADNITKVEFTPLSEFIQPDTSLFKDKPLPAQGLDNALEILSTAGTLSFQFEVDSTYNSESIYANFKRLLKEQSHDKRPVEIMGKQFKSSYILNVDNKPLATCYVSIFPYRNGSKAVVIAKTNLSPDAKYHVSASKQINEVKKIISEVINN